MSIAVIVNRNGGPEKSRSKRHERLRQTLKGGSTLHFTRDLTELDEVVAYLRDCGVDQVAVVGGDGTLSSVCSALYRHFGNRPLPTVLPLRGGTMNTIARSLGAVHGEPAERLRRAQQGTLRARSCGTLLVGGEVGFLFSSGVMASYLSEYYAASGPPGPLTAAGVLVRGAASVVTNGPLAKRLEQRVSARLSMDETPPGRRADYLFIGAGTVTQVGLGFGPFARVTPDSDAFHAIGHAGSLLALLKGLPALARGDGKRAGLHLDRLCEELRIDHEGPLLYALDGELRTSAGPTVLRSGPRMRFLV